MYGIVSTNQRFVSFITGGNSSSQQDVGRSRDLVALSKAIGLHGYLKRIELDKIASSSTADIMSKTVLSPSARGEATEIEDSNKSRALKEGKQQSRPARKSGHALEKLVPGYKAPLHLTCASLESLLPSRPSGLQELRRQALTAEKRLPMAVPSDMRSTKTSATTTTCFKKGKRPMPAQLDGWFDMKSSPMTEELQQDLSLIKNRGVLDPKRFYKSSDRNKDGPVQRGTVVEGPTEFFSARLTKKQRGGATTLLEQALADPSSSDYAKYKYRDMQREKTRKQIQARRSRQGKKG